MDLLGKCGDEKNITNTGGGILYTCTFSTLRCCSVFDHFTHCGYSSAPVRGGVCFFCSQPPSSSLFTVKKIRFFDTHTDQKLWSLVSCLCMATFMQWNRLAKLSVFQASIIKFITRSVTLYNLAPAGYKFRFMV